MLETWRFTLGEHDEDDEDDDPTIVTAAGPALMPFAP